MRSFLSSGTILWPTAKRTPPKVCSKRCAFSLYRLTVSLLTRTHSSFTAKLVSLYSPRTPSLDPVACLRHIDSLSNSLEVVLDKVPKTTHEPDSLDKLCEGIATLARTLDLPTVTHSGVCTSSVAKSKEQVEELLGETVRRATHRTTTSLGLHPLCPGGTHCCCGRDYGFLELCHAYSWEYHDEEPIALFSRELVCKVHCLLCLTPREPVQTGRQQPRTRAALQNCTSEGELEDPTVQVRRSTLLVIIADIAVVAPIVASIVVGTVVILVIEAVGRLGASESRSGNGSAVGGGGHGKEQRGSSAVVADAEAGDGCQTIRKETK